MQVFKVDLQALDAKLVGQFVELYVGIEAVDVLSDERVLVLEEIHFLLHFLEVLQLLLLFDLKRLV